MDDELAQTRQIFAALARKPNLDLRKGVYAYAKKISNRYAVGAFFEAAAGRGRLDYMEDALPWVTAANVQAALESAAARGDTIMMEKVREIAAGRGFPLDLAALYRKAAGALKSLLLCVTWDPGVLTAARRERLLVCAARRGAPEVVDAFLPRDTETPTRLELVLIEGASRGHANVVLYALERGARRITAAAAAAAAGGHADVVRLCFSCGAANYDWAMAEGARAGSLEIVETCFRRGARDFRGALRAAREAKKTKVARFLERHAAKNKSRTVLGALRRAHR